MAGNLPAYRSGRSIEASDHLTNRPAGSDPARDVLSFSECEC